ncbi:hypothetical protein [Brevibacillus daliensis]|uniref:hypothetical protein n=1 Tax=Brevibacillus daliensis TaxID=2892995 RepID=UPI001E6409BD|nr:hypothetical protein [Brevibacillus daliensis]
MNTQEKKNDNMVEVTSINEEKHTEQPLPVLQWENKNEQEATVVMWTLSGRTDAVGKMIMVSSGFTRTSTYVKAMNRSTMLMGRVA